jgi:hypothetical protein
LFQICKLNYENIIFQNTTTGEIEAIIKNLPLKGSSGYDEVSTKILKISATFISSPLWNIINKSFHQGYSPIDLSIRLLSLYIRGAIKIMYQITNQFPY